MLLLNCIESKERSNTETKLEQDCFLIEGRHRRTRFLLLWPWLWPDELDLRIWPEDDVPEYQNELYTSRLSEVRALYKQTDTQTDETEPITTPHSPVVKNAQCTSVSYGSIYARKATWSMSKHCAKLVLKKYTSWFSSSAVFHLTHFMNNNNIRSSD